tara:strand:+ start:455 stop:973 length:519 start_codon:yes stop_codon:yes gene_type:complete
MANYGQSYITSIFGNRIGLQRVTTSQFGSTVGPQATPAGRVSPDLLVGPSIRRNFTTAETSGTSLAFSGLSYITTASVAATTQTMYTLDRPQAGVKKYLVWASTNTVTNEVSVWASSDASIAIHSTQGTTMCVMRSTANFVGVTELMGISSAIWMVTGSLSSGAISMTTKTT